MLDILKCKAAKTSCQCASAEALFPGVDYIRFILQNGRFQLNLYVSELQFILRIVFAGGHLNPAISLAFLLAKKISLQRFVCYVISQLAGAMTGSALVYAVRL